VGITPFLSFLASLRASTESVTIDLTMILAVRRAEAVAMLTLVRQALESGPTSSFLNGMLSLHVVSAGVQDSDLGASTTVGGLQVSVTKHSQRLDPELLLSISGTEAEGADKPEAWVCGPASLEAVVMQTLQDAGWPADKLHRESFSF
jgi:ferredoxin-NADP reductase